MIEKVVFLEGNIGNENEEIIFHGDIPYVVEEGKIQNEDNITLTLDEINIDFKVRFMMK